MTEYTPEQVAEIQRRWVEQRSKGYFWSAVSFLPPVLAVIPATRAWLSALIEPVPIAVLILPTFVGVFCARRVFRCPACNAVIHTKMRTDFCPACGVPLQS